jgi:hypothetical protein
MREKKGFGYWAKILFMLILCYVVLVLTTHDAVLQPLGLKARYTNLDVPSPDTTQLKEGKWHRVVKDKEVVCSAFELPMVPKNDRRLIHEPLNCTNVLAKKLPAWVSLHNGVAVVDINVKHNRTSAVCMFWG